MSSAPLSAYHDQGFAVLEGLVSSQQVDALRADAVKVCRGAYPCDILPPVDAATSDEEALRQYLCVHQPHKLSPVLRQALALPEIVDALTRIIGPDVKCMQSMLFIKPPGFPGQAWHQDEIYIPTRDRSLCGGWIALDDATVENGCLWVIPGSHRRGVLYPQRAHDNPAEFDVSQESYGFDASGEIPVECPAGSVVFFNGYLLHRSNKNRSERYRRVLVNHYMSAASLLPWQLREHETQRTATADYRDIVLVAGEDPYAYKGTEDRGGLHVRSCG